MRILLQKLLPSYIVLKKGLHDTLENVDSQKIFNRGGQKIESAVKATGNGLKYIGNKLNLFNAMDNIVKFKLKVPNYILVQAGRLPPLDTKKVDSEKIFNQGAQKMESAVKSAGNGLKYAGNKLNVFNSIDNIAKFKHQGVQKMESAMKTAGNGLKYAGKKLNVFNGIDEIAKFKQSVPNYFLNLKGQLHPDPQHYLGTI